MNRRDYSTMKSPLARRWAVERERLRHASFGALGLQRRSRLPCCLCPVRVVVVVVPKLDDLRRACLLILLITNPIFVPPKMPSNIPRFGLFCPTATSCARYPEYYLPHAVSHIVLFGLLLVARVVCASVIDPQHWPGTDGDSRDRSLCSPREIQWLLSRVILRTSWVRCSASGR